MKRKNIKRVLVIAAPGIGDALLATPVVRAIRERYPTADIDMLVREGRAGIVRTMPDIANVIEFHYHAKILNYLKMVKRIFRRYDLAISTKASDRLVLSTVYAAPYRASIVPQFRLQDLWKRIVLHRFVVADPQQHILVQNRDLIASLELPPSTSLLTPEFTAETKQRVSAGLGDYAVVHCFSRDAYKRWPLAHWISVVSDLQAEGLEVVLSGGSAKREKEFNAELAEAFSQGVHDRSGQYNFSELTALLDGAACYVGVDTVVTHLAAASGVPTFAIFGPTDPVRWAPWPKDYVESDTPFSSESGIQHVGNVCLVRGGCQCKNFLKQCEHSETETSRCLGTLAPELITNAMSGFFAKRAQADAS